MNAPYDWSIRRHRAVRNGGSRVGAIALAIAGLIAGAMGGAALLGVPMPARAETAGLWLGPQTSSSEPAGPSTPPSEQPAQAAAPLNGPPTWLKIPDIAVSTTLESLKLNSDGTLGTPSYNDAGWYSQGTVPGDVGPAVIAGHIDSTTGPSVFYRLANVRVGDAIQVLRGGQWVIFTVTDVRRYPKVDFPTAQVYAPTPTAELRLITCGGSFDTARRSYDDNVVVYARETA